MHDILLLSVMIKGSSNLYNALSMLSTVCLQQCSHALLKLTVDRMYMDVLVDSSRSVWHEVPTMSTLCRSAMCAGVSCVSRWT